MRLCNRIALAGCTAAALFFVQVAPSMAHHSGSMFDRSKTLTMTGIVKQFQFTNPHSWLLVDVRDKDGTVTTWGFEAEGPSTLMRAGIRKSMLMPGTKVTITTHPMKNGKPAGTWMKLVRSDGKVLIPHPPRGN